MEQQQVIISERVTSRLKSLLDLLIKKGYFSYLENAEAYIKNLERFAETIPEQKKRLCKNPKYGSWYCRYKANRNTTWYFTFDTDGTYYIVRNVLNNHTKDYPIYIMGG